MGYRILLIEDEVGIADFVSRGLREEGFFVEHHLDGEKGLNALRASDWDVALLDWWLPGMDGLQVLKQFRKTNSATPVLFLTARDAVENRVEGLQAGADDYLCKPFSFDELLARVRALIRRKARGGGTLLNYGNLTIDLASNRAERGGKQLPVTAKELSLLAYFIRHPDEVLSRSRIYEGVWSENYDGFSNTLEVHVMELRKKLEMHGPRLVHTIRGRGYQFGETGDDAA